MELALDPFAVAMKAATLAGVLCTALPVALDRVSPGTRTRCLVLAAGGVALMFGNALVSMDPLAVLIDVAYVAIAAGMLVAVTRERRAWVPTPAEALRMPLAQPAPPRPTPAAAPRPAMQLPPAGPGPAVRPPGLPRPGAVPGPASARASPRAGAPHPGRAR